MTTDFDIRYDRRLDADFLAHFEAHGFAASLAAYARGGLFPIDLRPRRDLKSGRQTMTLYAGLTAVLKVRDTASGELALAAHPTHQELGRFDPRWTTPRSSHEWIDEWPEVELYLERVIPLASSSHGRTEGAVQAAIGRYDDPHRLVLDREVTPSFRDQTTRQQILAECAAPVLSALNAAQLGFSGMPKKLGNECDAMALTDDGRVLAIEVKPLSGGSLAWAPAQALMYARILQRWIGEPTEAPGDVLREMAAQRSALGLAGSWTAAVPERPTVTPVVAVQRGASPEMIRRMIKVRDALRSADRDLPVVELYEASLIGELIPLDESRAADGAPRSVARSYAARHNAAGERWKLTDPSLPAAARGSGSVKNRSGAAVDVAYALPRDAAQHNLLPEVRREALAMFRDLRISWHQSVDGGPSAHLRSSQVQCVNALGQMAQDPARVERAFGAEIDIAEVRDFGAVDPSEDGRFLTFEFIGPRDYLSEGNGGRRTRGAQCTSVDAAFAYRTSQGANELALVEWKFTEAYPGADRKAAAKLDERLRRYAALIDDPAGPIDRGDVPIEDLFHEPIYQLVRQQLLAWQLEIDPRVAADKVRVLHVLSPDNLAYERSYRAPSLASGSLSEAWLGLLRRPDRFVKIDPAVFLDPCVTSVAYVSRYALESRSEKV